MNEKNISRARRRSLRLVALLPVLLAALPARAQDVPNVAAAADLKFALEEVAARFRAATGREVKLAFGSSGNFMRQIAQGAPFQLFFSADEDYIFQLAGRGLARDRGVPYAVGRLALLVPHGSPVKADPELKDLAAALQDGRLKKFAIANPEHAPYGRRAQEALRHAGLWDKLKDKLVLGENVSQAAQFALSGAAQGGLVAYSLALSPEVAKLARHALVPEGWHQPLRQRMALMRNAGETAQAFYRYMQEAPAREILRRHGFQPPE